jgi:alginate O-acetyltransferase complex protein AlgI
LTFTELRFFSCLVPAVILFYCFPPRWRTHYLLVISYLFYFTWSVPYAVLLFGLTLLAFFLAIAVDRVSTDRAKTIATVIAVVLFVGILTVFKLLSVLTLTVFPHFGNSASGVARYLLMPLGISYYTFKLVSYVLDVYWGKVRAERDLAAVALYVAFFPQILSGPIQRAPDFLEQAKTRLASGLDAVLFEFGVGFILLGLLEKVVVADRIAPFIAQVDSDLQLHSGLTVLLSVYSYTFQMFADLSALTLIALGVGMLFGIQGPPNFDRPFAATNIQEFWRRWHMSLTTWLGDYLFLPLRMALRRWGNWGLSVSLLVNMVLIGVWHGLNINYLAFGLIHAVFMVSSALTSKRRNAFFKEHAGWEWLRKVWGQIVTFHLVTFALILFRASSLHMAVDILRAIVHSGTSFVADATVGGDILRSALAASCISLLLGYGLFSRRLEDYIIQMNGRFRYLAYGIALFAIVLLRVAEGGQFIYARF